MSIKENLCKHVCKIKEERKLTYQELSEITFVGITQLTLIVKHNGDGVHIKVIEDVLNRLGCTVEIHVYDAI